MRSTTQATLVTLFVLALLAPLTLANHTPPSNDTLNAGTMGCDARDGTIQGSGTATSQTLPILRTTDNGHVTLQATGQTGKVDRCTFAIKITGYSLPGGLNPQGGIQNVVSAPCVASMGASCTATADADWWVTFVDPINQIYTPEIRIFFDLVVNGNPVDSGEVRILDPSIPALNLP